jgi:hypothetical protein
MNKMFQDGQDGEILFILKHLVILVGGVSAPRPALGRMGRAQRNPSSGVPEGDGFRVALPILRPCFVWGSCKDNFPDRMNTIVQDEQDEKSCSS